MILGNRTTVSEPDIRLQCEGVGEGRFKGENSRKTLSVCTSKPGAVLLSQVWTGDLKIVLGCVHKQVPEAKQPLVTIIGGQGRTSVGRVTVCAFIKSSWFFAF